MSTPEITLLAMNAPAGPVSWPYGELIPVSGSVKALHEAIAAIGSRSGFSLLWDFESGEPDPKAVFETITQRGDLWPGGSPQVFQTLKFIKPCWMLSLQDQTVDHSVSWKIDLTHALIPNEIFRQMGNIFEGFESLEAAGLEFGYRCIRQGVIPVFQQALAAATASRTDSSITVRDEFTFLRRHFRRFWVNWAFQRAVFTRAFPLGQVVRSWYKTRHIRQAPSRLFSRPPAEVQSRETPRISVILITLGRIPYLHRVIEQLSAQTLLPLEMIVVDATPDEGQVRDFATRYDDSAVNIRYFRAERTGQCSQRNFGIQQAVGDYIFFMDDDMEEVKPDHLERHWQNMVRYRADVSSGVPDEVGALTINREKMCLAVSDVFPTNDSLVSIEALSRSGLFDERMDKGQSEDHELGIRLFKSGSLMVLDSKIRSLHLRASSGGLRTHGARKITRSSSQKKLLHRRLPHLTEIYLYKKHFSQSEVHQANLISLWSTLSFKGSKFMRLIKAMLGIILLPDSFSKIKAKERKATELIKKGEIIPVLKDKKSVKSY